MAANFFGRRSATARGRSSCIRRTARSCAPITPADFNLDEFIDLNEADRSIVVTGGPDPRERHLFRFALEAKAEPQRLTRESGTS